MRTFLIIEAPPQLDLAPSVVQRQEPVFIQALLAKAAIEALDHGVIRRCPTAGEVEFHDMLVHPSVHDVAGEFTAVIDLDRLR